jgi:hypothetical protein
MNDYDLYEDEYLNEPFYPPLREYPRIQIHDPFRVQSMDYFDYPEHISIPAYTPVEYFNINDYLETSIPEPIPEPVSQSRERIVCPRCEQTLLSSRLETHLCLPFVECPRCGVRVKKLEEHQQRNKRCQKMHR